MSRRGEITVECETPKCHAEQLFLPSDLSRANLDTLLWSMGWSDDDRCPLCVQEERDALESGLSSPLMRVVK